MKIAVMGAGGMGGYIGGRLAQAGHDVTFIARGAHLRAIQEDGLQVQSPAGDFVIQPARATEDPAEVGLADLVLLCVKSYDVPAAAKMLPPMMKPQTAIIPVQNGIDHLEKIGDSVGSEHVLGGVSLISGQIIEPGLIRHNLGSESLEFGELDGCRSQRCEGIEEAMAVQGIKASLSPNILERMWWKLAAYAGAGVFCVVRASKGVLWATPEIKALYHMAIAEAVAVAQAKGIGLSDSVPDEHLALLDTFPPEWRPSMLVALEQGHRLELEALQGAVRSMGRESGVPTPIADYIYACLKPYVDGRPQLPT
jgi:2-dehydropantoate 2-reductase